MSDQLDVIYTVDFARRARWEQQNPSRTSELSEDGIPRVARLMALAIRMRGLIGNQTIRDYAAVARLGGVSRVRITQIVKLLDLAPDIQEQLLLLPASSTINERNLRPIVKLIDWSEQRLMFSKLTGRFDPVQTTQREPSR